jgi:hypothetical protein
MRPATKSEELEEPLGANRWYEIPDKPRERSMRQGVAPSTFATVHHALDDVLARASSRCQKAHHRLILAPGPEVLHVPLEYLGRESVVVCHLLQIVIGHRASWFVNDDLALRLLAPVMTQVPVPGQRAPHELDIVVRYQLRRVVHAANGHNAVDALRELEASGISASAPGPTVLATQYFGLPVFVVPWCRWKATPRRLVC